MPSLIYHLPETAVTFTSSGGTVALTTTSLANGAGRISAQHDRSTGAKPGLYIVQAKMKFAAALVVGAHLEVYLLQSSIAGDVPGNLGTADAAVSSADKRRNLGAPVVVINADSTTNGEDQISNSGIIEIYGRYVSVFLWNASAQALHGTGTNSIVTITPVPAQIQ